MILMVRRAKAHLQSHEMKDQTACFVSLSFAGLVVLARSLNPIPSRTRPLNSSAPMVLWLKPWESRSLPDLPRTRHSSLRVTIKQNAVSLREGGVFVFAGTISGGLIRRILGAALRHDRARPVGSPSRETFIPFLRNTQYGEAILYGEPIFSMIGRRFRGSALNQPR